MLLSRCSRLRSVPLGVEKSHEMWKAIGGCRELLARRPRLIRPSRGWYWEYMPSARHTAANIKGPHHPWQGPKMSRPRVQHGLTTLNRPYRD